MKYLSKHNVALILLISFAVACVQKEQKLTTIDLKVEYKINPVIDEEQPRFSWILQDEVRGQFQTAYQIIVATSPDLLESGKSDVWDSGKVDSDLMSQVVYAGKGLEKTTVYFWKVRAWDKEGDPGLWSEPAKFETGLMDRQNWKAEWIGYDLTHLGMGKLYHLPPVPYLRNEIKLTGRVKEAKLYATALGVFDFVINGQKVGNEFLNPGWTNYDKRVHYRAYDVADYLQNGENSLGAIVSYGWYAGYLGYALLVGLPQVKGFYGDVPKLLAQLEVTYEDGKQEVFITDGNWKASKGPLIESDLLEGETYDARLELEGWTNVGYDDSKWESVSVFDDPEIAIEVHPGMPIRVIDRINPIEVTKRPEGYLFDLGQNFAGIIQLNVIGNKGDKLTIKYGEMLHPDGRLMTENLRMARATDTYIMKGDEKGESWQPRFTFHGFRYVLVSGLKSEANEKTITGLVLSSDIEKTSDFECGNEIINKLAQNIDWTQLSNFLDVPTDCPQRDERLGWTGDAQVYMNSAILNRNAASFYTKWLKDLNDDQWETGAYPNFAPTPYIRQKYDFSPGWMEAGIICPYNMYNYYGDTRIVEKYWSNMEKFMDFYKKRAGDNYVLEEASFEDIIPKGGFGDWLSIGKKTPPDMMATFYYAYSASLMTKMAKAIGRTDRANHYAEVFEKIKKDLLEHYGGAEYRFKCDASAYGNGDGYVDGNLGFDGHTQTAYANAIYMNLLDKKAEEQASDYLKSLVEQNNGKLATGFLGAKPLLPALSKTGKSALAYDLFLQTEYPSLGFEVVNGATTIWERWNSYTHEDGFGGEQNAGMNSFNHYAFGAVYEWMFEYAAGIKPLTPAYRTISVKPEPDKRLGYLNAVYHSISGEIVSAWKYQENGLEMNVKVPVNVEAEIYIPTASIEKITESGLPLDKAEGLTIRGIEDGKVVVVSGSGDYSFFIEQP